MIPTEITNRSFGKLLSGEEITAYTLSNNQGSRVEVINYGAIITDISMPDKDGIHGNVVMGFDSLGGYTSKEYLAKDPYFGAIIGRYAGRIAGGKFKLNGIDYLLETNNRGNHMHGGQKGFDKVVWTASVIDHPSGKALGLHYFSPDGEEGYPGNLQVTICYSLNNENEFRIDYQAVCDQASPINLTNHSYFNLSAFKAPKTLDHMLSIHAESYVRSDQSFIPLYEIYSLEGTALDFQQARVIGEALDALNAPGFNHIYILNNKASVLNLVARLYDPFSGRVLELHTTEPALVLYSGTFLDGTLTGKQGVLYEQYGGIALETQHFPDSPNRSDFPSTILNPGEKYRSSTIYKFSTKT